MVTRSFNFYFFQYLLLIAATVFRKFQVLRLKRVYGTDGRSVKQIV